MKSRIRCTSMLYRRSLLYASWSSSFRFARRERIFPYYDVGRDESGREAKDILYKIVYYYNALSMAEKNRVAENTERFIDERLRLLSSELGSVEDAVEDFMRNNELVDITANAASYLDESKSIEERLFDVETEMNRLDYVGSLSPILPIVIRSYRRWKSVIRHF